MYKQMMLRGDYGYMRRGDPGIWGSIKGAVTGGVRALVTGGNPITGAIGGAVTGWSSSPARPSSITPSFSVTGGGGGTALVGADNVPAVMGGGPLVGMGGTTAIQTGRGYHPNRSTYYTRSGRVAKGTKMVRNRSTNYGNGRALRRALRRAHGFQHLARSVMSFTLTGKKYKAPHFKAKARGR